MIGTRVQQYMRRLVENVMRPLARTGITPNMLTLIGLLLTIFTAGVIAFNHLRIGGVLVLCAGVFDMFDGAMARVAQKSSKFGAFFDSTLDRYAEGILLLGVIIYAQFHLPQQRVIGSITTANLVIWLTYHGGEFADDQLHAGAGGRVGAGMQNGPAGTTRTGHPAGSGIADWWSTRVDLDDVDLGRAYDRHRRSTYHPYLVDHADAQERPGHCRRGRSERERQWAAAR